MTRAGGYTLLEMVVVLALLGLAVGMTAPAGFRMIGSWREATEVEQVLRQIAALPARARQEGLALTLQAAPAEANVISLPEGWSLEMSAPLRIGSNGACSDAQGRLSTTRQTVDFHVQAPFCRIRRETGQ